MQCSAGMRPAPVLLTAPALRHVVVYEVLPHLSFQALSSLACTCKSLREATYQREDLWASTAAASLILPASHPTLPTLASLDRASVQAIMNRQAAARKNVWSGEAVARREVSCGAFDDVRQVVLNRDCTRFAVISTRFVSMYTVEDGACAWQRDCSSLHAQDRPSDYEHGVSVPDYSSMHWQFRSESEWHKKEQLLGCSQGVLEPSEWQLLYVHLIQLSVQSGERNLGSWFSMVGCEDEHNMTCQPAFSVQGNLLAASFRYFDEYEERHFSRLFLQDLDSEDDDSTLELEGYALPAWKAHNMQPPSTPKIASDGSMLAWEDRLLHLPDGLKGCKRFELGEGDHVDATAMSFDRTGRMLGYTCISVEADREVAPRHASAVFANAATAHELFRVEESKFAAFLSTRQWALVIGLAEQGMTQVWDLTQQTHLQNLAVSPLNIGAQPCLCLNDTFVLGREHWPLHASAADCPQPCFYDVSSGAALLCVDRASWWVLSSDECSVVVVTYLQGAQEWSCSLVRLVQPAR